MTLAQAGNDPFLGRPGAALSSAVSTSTLDIFAKPPSAKKQKESSTRIHIEPYGSPNNRGQVEVGSGSGQVGSDRGRVEVGSGSGRVGSGSVGRVGQVDYDFCCLVDRRTTRIVE